MPDVIYQSADYQLYDPDKKKPLPDKSNKLVAIGFDDWHGFVTYTGLGRFQGQHTSAWMAKWFAGIERATVTEVAVKLQEKMTKVLDDLYRTNRERYPHTFVLAAFLEGRVRLSVISNFEDSYGKYWSPKADLSVTGRSLRNDAKPLVLINGQQQGVSKSSRRQLRELAARQPDNDVRIRQEIQRVNRDAARLVGTDKVSEGCTIVSVARDGSGAVVPSGPVGVWPQRVSRGIDMNKMVMDALAGLGVQVGNVEIAQEVSASSGAPALARRPCVPVFDTGANIEFELVELTADSFELMSATAINNDGAMVGSGRRRFGQPQDIPWLWRDGFVTRLPYVGSAASINDTAAIVGNIDADGGDYRSVVYQNSELKDLGVYHGTAGVFEGSGSSARAINSNGSVAITARSRKEERGRPNTRPAISRPGCDIEVLEGVEASFGCEAIAINDADAVLFVQLPALFEARSFLWDPINNSVTVVGDAGTNVSPIALSNDFTVLGQARTDVGAPLAMVCRLGSSVWARLGTNPGWKPHAMNNNGDVVGSVTVDGVERPWLREASGQTIQLPFVRDHHTCASAINDRGDVVGGASAGHGAHALLWKRVGT
jgi:uncharacterized membrane protein